MSAGDGEVALVLPFDTDEPAFRRGVEIGMLWQTLAFYGQVETQIHADCAEMVIRIAEAKCQPFTAVPVGEDWLHVTIGATGGEWHG